MIVFFSLKCTRIEKLLFEKSRRNQERGLLFYVVILDESHFQ